MPFLLSGVSRLDESAPNSCRPCAGDHIARVPKQDVGHSRRLRPRTELIRRRGPWRNTDAVELATLEWVNWFNTSQRGRQGGLIDSNAKQVRCDSFSMGRMQEVDSLVRHATGRDRS